MRPRPNLRQQLATDTPAASSTTERKLKTSVSKADMLALQHALRAKQPHKYADLNARLETHIELDVPPHRDTIELQNADRHAGWPHLGASRPDKQ
jgi:hypothetical protein